MPLKLAAKFWSDQRIRYLFVGGFNTAAGYSTFFILYYLLSPVLHWFVIQSMAKITSITIAYFGYKFVVFRTRGNYIRDYLKMYLVYALPIVMGYTLFPLLVIVLRMNPYLSQAIILVLTVTASYFGHKHFSFKRKSIDSAAFEPMIPVMETEAPAMETQPPPMETGVSATGKPVPSNVTEPGNATGSQSNQSTVQ